LGPTERDQALREALEAARAIEDGFLSRVLAALALRLTEPLLGEALEAARAIGNEVDRSEALAALAPRLTEPLLGEALVAARAIGNEENRSRALAALAPQLAELTPAALYPLWSKTIRLSATRTREGLLGDLCTLVPVLARLGGAEATAETSARSKTWGGGGRNGRLVAGGLREEGDPRLPCRAPAGGLSRAGLHDARRRPRRRQPLQRLPGAQRHGHAPDGRHPARRARKRGYQAQAVLAGLTGELPADIFALLP